jgi:DNA-directed RNA polymerase specialized sigma24 family protein
MDKMLVQGCKEGDIKAWEALMTQMGPFLMGICKSKSFNDAECEDFFAEVLFRIWEKKEVIFSKDLISPQKYLAKLANNVINSCIKDRKNFETEEKEISDIPTPDNSIYESIDLEDTLQSINNKIKKLFLSNKISFRELVIYSFYRYHKDAELCQRTFDIEKNKVYELVRKIKKILTDLTDKR